MAPHGHMVCNVAGHDRTAVIAIGHVVLEQDVAHSRDIEALLRAIETDIVAENEKLKAENNDLKSKYTIIITDDTT